MSRHSLLYAAVHEGEFCKLFRSRNELAAHLKAEIDKWSPIIKKAGVYAD